MGAKLTKQPAPGLASSQVANSERAKSAATLSPAFDRHHPPDQKLVDDCVHCGFCLPTCPTYLLWGQEMDSPRGRIYLMKQGLKGAPMDAALVRHMDQCLGCLSCMTACPSGVQYGKLLESARSQVERRYPRSKMDRALRRAIFELFPYPRRLALMRRPLALYQNSGLRRRVQSSRLIKHLPPSLVAMEALLPPVQPSQPLAQHTAATSERRMTVGMLTGCVQSVFFPNVNAATARVLAAEGCDVLAPAGQGCCGALSSHMGREAQAQGFARKMIDAFEACGVQSVIVNAAGCGSTMKEYGHLLRDDPKYAKRAQKFAASVKDISEFLVELGPRATRHPLAENAAYHDACHLSHGQQIKNQPRELLRSIPGLKLADIPEGEICCGSAGVYNLLEPQPAAELGRRKAANALSTGADVLITANPGCLLQIASAMPENGRRMRLYHTVEVLDASIRAVALSELDAARGKVQKLAPPARSVPSRSIAGLRGRFKKRPGSQAQAEYKTRNMRLKSLKRKE